MHYKIKFNSLKYLIKIVIELDDKIYLPVIEIYLINSNNKCRTYQEYTSHYIKKLKTYRQFNNSYWIYQINWLGSNNIKELIIKGKKKKDHLFYIYDKSGNFTMNYSSNNKMK